MSRHPAAAGPTSGRAKRGGSGIRVFVSRPSSPRGLLRSEPCARLETGSWPQGQRSRRVQAYDGLEKMLYQRPIT
jgi:hypothetical protein